MIRFLVSSDIHGSVMPYRYSDKKPCDHGFLKIRASMEEYIDENTLILDNGDTIEGSPLLKYHHLYEADTKNPMCDAMGGFVRYYNLGNHDFSFGRENLLKFIEDFDAVCICGNISCNGKRLGEKYVIHEFPNGVKIALLGACTQYIVNWEPEEKLEGFVFTDAAEFFQDTVKEIKEKESVDAIVALYHGGYEKDEDGNDTELQTKENEGYEILKTCPDIDVFITGHQHRSFAKTFLGRPTTQTRANGVEFALIDYDVRTKESHTEIIPAKAEAHKEDLEKFKAIEERVDKWLDSPLGHVVNEDLEIHNEFKARFRKHPLVSFLNQVQKEVSGAQLSANAVFHHATGFKKDITMRDIVSTYVYPNTITVLEIDGKTLKEYLEKCAEYFKVENGWVKESGDLEDFNYDMIDGIDYTIDVTKEKGDRIVSMKYQGEEIREDDTFSLAVNNYRAGGGGNFFMLLKCKHIKDMTDDMVSVLADYLLEKKEITVDHRNNIRVLKEEL